MDIKEIKSEIRRLKKLKLQCRSGSAERISLHRQIGELKEKLSERQEVNKDKEKIIKKIIECLPDYLKAVKIDYTKFTIEQLKNHLERIRK